MTEYQLRLPFQRPPPALWGNQRKGHWGARASDTRAVRHAVMTLARQARIPPADHLTVELVWAPGDRKRRDEDNLYWLLKACCDGLARGPHQEGPRAAHWIGLNLVPDDTHVYMAKSAYILSPDETPAVGMWLIVTTDAPRRRAVPLLLPEDQQRHEKGNPKMTLEIYVDEDRDRVLVSWGRGALTVVGRDGQVSEQFAVAGEKVWPAADAAPAPAPRKEGEVKVPERQRPVAS